MLQQAEKLLVNFMESKTGYASASGEIVGILKSMNDEMTADLKDATDSENEAMASFDELVAAKAKEIDALTASIESKTTRSRRRSCIHRMIKLGLSNPVPVEQIQQVRVPVPNPIPVPTPVVQTPNKSRSLLQCQLLGTFECQCLFHSMFLFQTLFLFQCQCL